MHYLLRYQISLTLTLVPHLDTGSRRKPPARWRSSRAYMHYRTLPTQQEGHQDNAPRQHRRDHMGVVGSSAEGAPRTLLRGTWSRIPDKFQVEAHTDTSNIFKDSHDFYIRGEPSTRISQVRKDKDMPEFLPKPMKLNEIVESNSK